ncbi:hypothetical protein Fcan01_10428 [Folsomia candida]|uniref:Uncharacterized protein n=1 Tax=Folsomia candida TaxID=158441 RepID=A0A226E9Z2_FOLCA|nr:hypothetical protein Fcan01_10428 [Folsomia candida]
MNHSYLENNKVSKSCNFDHVTVSVMGYKLEGIVGVVEATTGIIRGDRAAESTLRDMQFMSNFRINLRILDNTMPSDPTYFSGGIGKLLISNETDLGIGYFYVNQDRVQLVAPLIPLMSDGLYVYFVQPLPNSVRNIYLNPLSWELIVFMILTMVIISMIGEAINFKSKVSEKLSEIFILTTSLMTQQAGYVRIKKTVSRLTHLYGLILSYVIYSMFGGKLLSAILRPVIPVQTIQDLVTLDFTFFSIPTAKTVVFNGKMPLGRREFVNNNKAESIRAAVTGHQTHAHIDVGFDSMNSVLWFVQRLLNIKMSDETMCERLSILKFSRSNVFLTTAFYVNRKSVWRNRFNINILKIKETGLMKRYFANTNPRKPRCDFYTVKPSYDPDLGLRDTSTAFLLFLFGIFVSGVILIMERLKQVAISIPYVEGTR